MTIDTNTMPRFQGTKTLKAHPMSRGEYNAYRGWSAPVDEDMGERGYLVEYTDGGKPNDSRHAGYISWTPADVFEKTYRPIGTHEDRVRLEAAELSEKLTKLSTFIRSPRFIDLHVDERTRLCDQRDHMERYLDTLSDRIEAFAPAHHPV